MLCIGFILLPVLSFPLVGSPRRLAEERILPDYYEITEIPDKPE
jgi:hypothetical protein